MQKCKTLHLMYLRRIHIDSVKKTKSQWVRIFTFTDWNVSFILPTLCCTRLTLTHNAKSIKNRYKCRKLNVILTRVRSLLVIYDFLNTKQNLLKRHLLWSLSKICQDMGFPWPGYFRIKTESSILSLYVNMLVSEKP